MKEKEPGVMEGVEDKRSKFLSSIQEVKEKPTPQQITPPSKGIKRYFNSEEVKKPKKNANGALVFEHSKDSPTIKDLFGARKKSI